jgi:starch phosphorylase
LASWLSRVQAAWPKISVESTTDMVREIKLGELLHVSARVNLNGLDPEDVGVQVLSGQVNGSGDMSDVEIVPMRAKGYDASGISLYEAVLKYTTRSGLHGYAIRVLPRHANAVHCFVPGLITWGSKAAAVSELQLR